MLRRQLTWLVLLGFAGTAEAGRLLLPISLRDGRPPGVRFINGSLRIQKASTGDAATTQPSSELRFQAPGLVTVSDVEAGTWIVTVNVPGYWHPPQVVSVGAQDSTAELQLWPTSTLTGIVKLLDRAAPIEQMLVRFQSAPAVASAERLPITEIQCPVQNQRWSCEVPAGLVDLRVRARGYVSVYVWDQQLPSRQVRDLGVMTLRRGSSVVGRVVASPRLKAARESIRVILEPLGYDDGGSRRSLRALGAGPNARGIFQIEGVPPGQYRVLAAAGRATSAPQVIRVLADAEVEMLDVLELEPPNDVRFELDPPASPGSGKWQVRIARGTDAGGRVDTVAVGSADESGVWRQELRSDTYTVTVSAGGGRWLSRSLAVDGGTATVRLTIPVVEVSGTVTVADRPLAAKLHFGGEYGAVAVVLESDAEGRFAGILPVRERWSEVTVDAATVKRTLKDVEVVRRDGEERARLDLRLPGGTVAGIVVDEAGAFVTRATVNVRAAGEPLAQIKVHKDGSFDVGALQPGTVTLQAVAEHAESDVVAVTVGPEQMPEVRLTVRKYRTLAGRVLSTLGPVPGARVSVIPTDKESLVVIPATTDVKGTFAAALPSGAREVNVLVSPPGFSFKMFHISLGESVEPIDIPVDQSGGTIIVDTPQFGREGLQPYLVHNGAEVGLAFTGTTRFEAGTSEGSVRLRARMIERGHYSVCLASPDEVPMLRLGRLPAARCRGGFLAPNGELALQLSAD